MNKSENKKIEEFGDLLEKFLVTQRDVAPGYSQEMLNLTRKIDQHMENHKRDMDEINKRFDQIETKLEPVYGAFLNAKGFKTTLLVALSVVGAISGAMIAIKQLINHFK